MNGIYKLCRQKLSSSFSVWAVVSLLLLLRCSSKSTIPHQRPESTLQFKTCPPITALYGSNSPRWHLHNKRDDKLIHWHPSLSFSPPSHSPHSPTLLVSPSPVTPPLLLLCQDPKSPSTALTLLPSPLISSCPSGWSATAPTLTAPRPPHPTAYAAMWPHSQTSLLCWEINGVWLRQKACMLKLQHEQAQSQSQSNRWHTCKSERRCLIGIKEVAKTAVYYPMGLLH